MLNVTNEALSPVNMVLYRQRIAHLRQVYQQTFQLLEQEGKRLNDFLGRGVPGSNARSHIAGDEAECLKLLEDLTDREKDTLRCIAEGCSTKETAARLGIRFKTAACHRYRIMQKLGVHETTSLVRFAIRCGLVRI